MAHMQSEKQSSIGAFTLLEMAIVILILGIIGIGAITTFNSSNEKRQYTDTQYKINKIQNALISFFAANGRLPCPAGPTQPRATQNFGVGITSTSTQGPRTCSASGILSSDVSGGVGIDMLYYGAVPVRDLGLGDDDSFDAFGNRIGYVVQRAFINSTSTNNFCLPGFKARDVNNDVRYMCYVAQSSGSVNPNNLDINILPYFGSTTYSSRNAVYILISHGANGYGAFHQDANGSGYSYDRNPCPPASNTAEIQNLDCSAAGVYTSINVNYISAPRNQYFDDLVVYLNRNDLLKACNNYGASSCFNIFNIIPK